MKRSGFTRKPPRDAARADTPRAPLTRTPFAPAPKSPTFAEQREAAKQAALKRLDKARRLADRTGAELSPWEDGFLDEVAARVDRYGRAFGDPEKGAAGQALSVRQTRKLKEIAAKAKDGKKG